MILHTASEGITLAKKLENDSASFYETMAQRYTQDAETFLSFARENKKNIVQIDRTYYGVITDAIEGCFCFNMEEQDYLLETGLPQNSGYSDALEKAIDIEDKIVKFYTDAAGQSQSLMADIPRLFKLLLQKRKARRQKLESLLSM
jgi:hypothetical protein